MDIKTEKILKEEVNKDILLNANEFIEFYSKDNEFFYENVQNLFLENNIEEEEEGGEEQEIFEWYFVSKWLFDKLLEHGEPVLETDTYYIWGRTCTGQMITMDYCIQEIYKKFLEVV